VIKKTDVVVVGGGPCGSYSAYTSAKLGAQVVVCEEHKDIGVPDHCAGHLNISSLKRLGIRVPKHTVENEIEGAIFHSPSGNDFVLNFQSPVTYVVNRELFDKYLAELAMKAGATYCFNSRVTSLLFNSGYVKGVVLNKKEKLESDVVIDAEGCSSAILKKTGLHGLNSSMIVRGVQAEVDGVEVVNDKLVEVYLGKKFAPDFYAWIIPKKGGKAKVGLATSSGNPNEYLQKFIKKHPVASKKFYNSKITDISFHPIPLAGPISKTYLNGFLVVGDAASQVKPTTGGGVIFGLICAGVAGEVAYHAVRNNVFSENFLSCYSHLWKRLVGFELSVMLQIRKMLSSFSDKRTDKLISLCKRMRVHKTIEKFGDLDFQGRSLISMMKYPGTLPVISYFLYSYLVSLIKKGNFF
jgi:geranylgeranyl reductase family protein